MREFRKVIRYQKIPSEWKVKPHTDVDICNTLTHKEFVSKYVKNFYKSVSKRLCHRKMGTEWERGEIRGRKTEWTVSIKNGLTHQYEAYLIAQSVQNLPAVQETQVRFLGREDPLEKEMASTQVSLPGESHGQRSLAGYSPWTWLND